MRDGAPSVRKPSLAIREGALGYRTPQPLPLPSAQWPPWRLPEHVGRTPPLWGRGVMGAPAPRWGRVLLVAYCGPRLPPLSWGRVPLGPAGCPASGELCVCCVVRSRPRGVSPGGRGGGVGVRLPGRPRLPQPCSRGEEEPVVPALAPEPQPVAVWWARSGPPSLESVSPGC